MAEKQPESWLGTFLWNELGTHDPATAKSLLATLFGWKTEEMPMGPEGTYTVFKAGEKSVGGAWDMKGEKHAHLPAHWMGYVGVASADATVATAGKLGMTVQVPPTDIPNVGRFAVLDHPATGVFAILEPKPM